MTARDRAFYEKQIERARLGMFGDLSGAVLLKYQTLLQAGESKQAFRSYTGYSGTVNEYAGIPKANVDDFGRPLSASVISANNQAIVDNNMSILGYGLAILILLILFRR